MIRNGWRMLATMVVLSMAWAGATADEATRSASRLPAFSEEREAAALKFVEKQAPELQSILKQLRADDLNKYKQEIREIFHVSELLSDLREEDEQRYKLELDVWKTETKALILVAKMAHVSEPEQFKLKEELLQQTRRLVDLEMQVLQLRVDELQKELTQSKDELAKAREKRDLASKDRLDQLLAEARRRGMMR